MAPGSMVVLAGPAATPSSLAARAAIFFSSASQRAGLPLGARGRLDHQRARAGRRLQVKLGGLIKGAPAARRVRPRAPPPTGCCRRTPGPRRAGPGRRPPAPARAPARRDPRRAARDRSRRPSRPATARPGGPCRHCPWLRGPCLRGPWLRGPARRRVALAQRRRPACRARPEGVVPPPRVLRRPAGARRRREPPLRRPP